MQPMRSKRASFFFWFRFFVECFFLLLVFSHFGLRRVLWLLRWVICSKFHVDLIFYIGKEDTIIIFFFDACFRIAVLVPAFFSLGFSHLNLIWFFSHF